MGLLWCLHPESAGSAGELLTPGEHAALQVLHPCESHGFEHHGRLSAAVATAAIDDDFAVFKSLECVHIGRHDASQRMKDPSDVELFMFVGFPYVNEIELFAGIDAVVQFFNGDDIHGLDFITKVCALQKCKK